MKKIVTRYGLFTPQYVPDSLNRRRSGSVERFLDGSIRSITLQEATEVTTSVGIFKAEKLLFYPSGELRRLFPLDGKLSGFWSWENEFALAIPQRFVTSSGTVAAPCINLHFHENNQLKSFTLWPGTTANLSLAGRPVSVRIGASFFPDGKLRSLEPHSPLPVETPIGSISAYDTLAEGISGDLNSLRCNSSGAVSSLCTITHSVEVTSPNGRTEIFAPSQRSSLCSEGEMEPIPLTIRWDKQTISFQGERSGRYSLSDTAFRIQEVHPAPLCADFRCS